MKYRSQTEVADALRRIADGHSSDDPLRAHDAAELERIAAHVEQAWGLQADLRVRLLRAVEAAYSLGTRHALERTQGAVKDLEAAYEAKIEVLEKLVAAYEQPFAPFDHDRERVNLATGEITTVGEDGADHV